MHLFFLHQCRNGNMNKEGCGVLVCIIDVLGKQVLVKCKILSLLGRSECPGNIIYVLSWPFLFNNFFCTNLREY